MRPFCSNRICGIVLGLTLLLAQRVEAQYVVAQEVFPQNRFQKPVEFVPVPGRPGLVAVAYQSGHIRILDLNAPDSAARLMLNLTNRTVANNELGLLGLAFHPRFPRVNKIYVNYTNNVPPNQQPPGLKSILACYRVDTATLKADSANPVEILSYAQPAYAHKGGKVQFGPDGMLYNAAGDGGIRYDTAMRAQNRTLLLGKIHRIDIDRQDSGLNYAIPRDNPFADSAAPVRREIYAYGFRNPWRFSWDFPTRRLWVGDVGANVWEEIDTVVAGGNYGWSLKEANACRWTIPGMCDPPYLIDPIYQYVHGTNGFSITGGHVYRGRALPFLYGTYVYADYASGKVWSLRVGPGSTVTNTLIGTAPVNLTNIGVDAEGELYVMHLLTGAINRLVLDPTAVRQDLSQPLLRCYPNPAHGRMQVRLEGEGGTPSLELCTLTGQSLRYDRVTETGSRCWQVSLEGLPAGAYLLRAKTERTVVTRRILVD